MLPGMSRDTIKGSMLTHILKAVFHEGMELGNENGEKNHLEYFLNYMLFVKFKNKVLYVIVIK